jgi:hypothetical protein
MIKLINIYGENLLNAGGKLDLIDEILPRAPASHRHLPWLLTKAEMDSIRSDIELIKLPKGYGKTCERTCNILVLCSCMHMLI